MLHELRVRNLLLIDSLELCLAPGFNVMTGETGAGKSVVIGALQLVLGQRTSADHVRPGSEYAEIDALFELSPNQCLREFLPESVASLLLSDSSDPAHGPSSNPFPDPIKSPPTHPAELIVRRVVLPSNRSRAYLNGRLCTAQDLTKLAPFLADIASQHQSVSLTDVNTHIGYLDAFGQLDAYRETIARRVTELHRLRIELDELSEIAKNRAEQQDFLLFQLRAIEQHNPKPGELESLQNERSRLRHAEKLSETTANSLRKLADDQALCDQLRTIVSDLHFASSLDPSLVDTASSVKQSLDSLVENSRTLERYVESNHADPARLDEVESRLFSLEKLLRRYGPTETDLLQAQEQLREQLDKLQLVDDAVASLEKRFNDELNQAGKEAFLLSEKRQQVATLLADSIGKQLASLGMGGAQVQVQVEKHPAQGDLVFEGARLTYDGVDRVEFLIAPNKGIEPRPLRKIASGGELSRALLAIKRVLASEGPASLYVFDEVDAGVGGAVAERIGQALVQIAKHRQVLCITHLAPIAALADAHFVVRKNQSGDIARTEVVRVTGEQRVQEVARMLSGKKITNAAMQAAKEMIAAKR